MEALIVEDRPLGPRSARRASVPPMGVYPQRPVVAPFARSLALLGAFTPQEPWLGTRELAARTGLAPSTTTRIAQTLVQLGYLHHSSERRRYRLAAPVLALGYGALANSDVQRAARALMPAFAEQHRVHMSLSSRDRLDVVVVESCRCAQSPVALNLHVGLRLGIVSSPIGWALLAALPELERYYLLEHAERRQPRDWPHLRRRVCEGISQMQQHGFCVCPDDAGRELTIVAAPVRAPGHSPLVLACVGASAQITRPRVQRELGPRMVALASAVQDVVSA